MIWMFIESENGSVIEKEKEMVNHSLRGRDYLLGDLRRFLDRRLPRWLNHNRIHMRVAMFLGWRVIDRYLRLLLWLLRRLCRLLV